MIACSSIIGISFVLFFKIKNISHTGMINEKLSSNNSIYKIFTIVFLKIICSEWYNNQNFFKKRLQNVKKILANDESSLKKIIYMQEKNLFVTPTFNSSTSYVAQLISNSELDFKGILRTRQMALSLVRVQHTGIFISSSSIFHLFLPASKFMAVGKKCREKINRLREEKMVIKYISISKFIPFLNFISFFF